MPPLLVRARSLARTSASAPLARSRARLSDGSDRVITISRVLGGMWSSAKSIESKALDIRDALEVVEHESERGAKRRDAVHQVDHRTLDGMSGRLQPPQRTAAKAAAHSFDRHRRVGPEPHRVVVAGLEQAGGRCSSA